MGSVSPSTTSGSINRVEVALRIIKKLMESEYLSGMYYAVKGYRSFVTDFHNYLLVVDGVITPGYAEKYKLEMDKDVVQFAEKVLERVRSRMTCEYTIPVKGVARIAKVLSLVRGAPKPSIGVGAVSGVGGLAWSAMTSKGTLYVVKRGAVVEEEFISVAPIEPYSFMASSLRTGTLRIVGGKDAPIMISGEFVTLVVAPLMVEKYELTIASEQGAKLYPAATEILAALRTIDEIYVGVRGANLHVDVHDSYRMITGTIDIYNAAKGFTGWYRITDKDALIGLLTESELTGAATVNPGGTLEYHGRPIGEQVYYPQLKLNDIAGETITITGSQAKRAFRKRDSTIVYADKTVRTFELASIVKNLLELETPKRVTVRYNEHVHLVQVDIESKSYTAKLVEG